MSEYHHRKRRHSPEQRERERNKERDREGRDWDRDRERNQASELDHRQNRDRQGGEHYQRKGQDRKRNRDDDDKKYEWGKQMKAPDEIKKEPGDEKPKEKPSFALSGNLAKETNTFNGVVIKYNEPPEARKPKLRWRLYPFKGQEALEFIPVHRQSAYLLGRDRRVADIPIDHPSCSKQHAVLQYRFIKKTLDDGTVSRRVRPYLIDLGSGNGTFINNKQIEPERYYELFEKDVVKFGFSSREYVLLHENSQDEANEDEDAEESDVNKVKEETSP